MDENVELAAAMGRFARELHGRVFGIKSSSDVTIDADQHYMTSYNAYSSALNRPGRALLDRWITDTHGNIQQFAQRENAPTSTNILGGAVNRPRVQPFPSIDDLVQWGRSNGVDVSKVARTDGVAIGAPRPPAPAGPLTAPTLPPLPPPSGNRAGGRVWAE